MIIYFKYPLILIYVYVSYVNTRYMRRFISYYISVKAKESSNILEALMSTKAVVCLKTQPCTTLKPLWYIICLFWNSIG